MITGVAGAHRRGENPLHPPQIDQSPADLHQMRSGNLARIRAGHLPRRRYAEQGAYFFKGETQLSGASYERQAAGVRRGIASVASAAGRSRQ